MFKFNLLLSLVCVCEMMYAAVDSGAELWSGGFRCQPFDLLSHLQPEFLLSSIYVCTQLPSPLSWKQVLLIVFSLWLLPYPSSFHFKI